MIHPISALILVPQMPGKRVDMAVEAIRKRGIASLKFGPDHLWQVAEILSTAPPKTV